MALGPISLGPISLLPWYCRKKLEKITIKKLQKVPRVVYEPVIASYNAVTLTTEPLGHLVTAADQAYLIITNVLIYCTVVVMMSRDVDGK